jgi:hypothetical protein
VVSANASKHLFCVVFSCGKDKDEEVVDVVMSVHQVCMWRSDGKSYRTV